MKQKIVVFLLQPVEGAAVMVFIYGGAFNVGWAHQSTYIGTALAATGDVIVVAANYRLGVLGFLSTGKVKSIYEHIFVSPPPPLRSLLPLPTDPYHRSDSDLGF